MRNEQQIHIFDDSSCLTSRQLKDYVSGSLTNEEVHAIEVHLNSCPFCNEAAEGMFAAREGRAAEVMAGLDTDFLQEHFGKINPQIHLNSLAPAHAATHTHMPRRRKVKAQPLWLTSTVAAGFLLLIGLIWFARNGSRPDMSKQIAANTEERVDPEQVALTQAESNTPEPASAPADNATGNAPIPQTNGNNGPVMPPLYAKEAEEQSQAKEAPQTELRDAPVQQPQTVADASREDLIPENTVATAKMPAVAAYDDTRATDNVKALKESEAPTGTERLEAIKASKSAKKEKNNLPPPDKLKMAESFYKQGKYDVALAAYKQEMKSPDAERSADAKMGAAECYMAMGKTENARRLLEQLAAGEGKSARVAKKMLRKLKD